MSLALALLAGVATDAAATPVDEIKALLARGDAKGAYARAKRYPDLLGEPAGVEDIEVSIPRSHDVAAPAGLD